MAIIPNRYLKNENMLSEAENHSLATRRVCIVGCGGLGGFVAEMLGRMGVGELTVVDGDTFDATNLNRQLYSTEDNLGTGKAAAAAERFKTVNREVKVRAVDVFLDPQNGGEIIRGQDVVVDALDSISTRLLLQDLCREAGIPLVHGAIAGWLGQVSTLLPGDDSLSRIYAGEGRQGIEQEWGNAPFTAGAVASAQAAEVLKLLLNRGTILRKKLLRINLLDHTCRIFDIA